ncbi:hypothetical protein LEP1GSC058_4147 [Leptospira fainei serovar Hurstbridge str. BUT 6]|uniref:HD domain protein n=2 Tax=Leptospira fainei TaxID=48782 RepID=S3UXA6_9LEPT|nr:hypothetical protein LEP1GSC058_4147 [Leptospira fainei serovar Hurstbridge str. BUT 6]
MASGDDINRLQKFEAQGIYFLTSEIGKISLSLGKTSPSAAASFEKLINPQLTVNLCKGATELLKDIRNYPLTGAHVRSVGKSIDSILEDFKSSPNMETGLVNILEVMANAGAPVDSEVLTKRTVIAMAMKVRTAKAFTKIDAELKKIEQMNLMIASYMADIGYTQMKMPSHSNLKTEEFEYIKNHPIISYFMIANIPELQDSVKSIVLNHHRPHRGEGLNNNYPQPKQLVQKLQGYREKYKGDFRKNIIVNDIQKQARGILTNALSYDDIGILSIAGEFASLTTAQPWREPVDSKKALKLILNNSYFAYNEKTLKDFYDHVGLSLSDNQPFIKIGDYVIVASPGSNRNVFFEVCVIQESYKNSIRPMLERIGTIKPTFINNGKFRISGFEKESLNLDRRRAVFNLERNGDPRRIIYLIDPEMDREFFEFLDKKARDLPKTSSTDSDATSKSNLS